MSDLKNEVILPYFQIKKMNEFLANISLKSISDNTLSIDFLAKNLDVSKSTASNLVTNLKSLNFVEGKGKLTLTEKGNKYIKAIVRKDLKEAKLILMDQVKDLDHFEIINQKLNQKGKLDIAEIGNQIAIYYDKKWENPLTIKRCGSAISSIFDFLEMGYYTNGTLAITKNNLEIANVPAPSITINKILDLLKSLFPDGKDFNTLAENLDANKKRLSNDISCCITLGLVERTFRGFYKLTDVSEKIIHPNTNEIECKMLFKNVILSSPYKKIIDTFPEQELDSNSIGQILRHELRKQWSSSTTKTHANKFINWLNYAEIIENTERGKYILKSESIKTLQNDENELKIERESILTNEVKIEIENIKYKDLLRYYLLGKNIGSILAQTGKIEANTDTITNVIALCREDKNLKEALDYWKDDYNNLFKEIKDIRIFLRDIDHLEKLLGVKK